MDEKPKLRAVEAIPYQSGGEQLVCLRDPSGLSPKTVVLPARAFLVAALCDGEHTLRDIQTEYVRRFGDVIFIEKVAEMVRQLDEALLLEGERYEGRRRAVVESFARSTTRPAAFAGSGYPAQTRALRAMLDGFFTAADGPGKIEIRGINPAPHNPASQVVAVAAPHIDLRRGGPTFAHAYKALAERCAAETFVVLGIAHRPTKSLFVMTDKDFETPLGPVACDRDATRDLMARAGIVRDEDELAHRSEHSIEFQAVFLRYVFGPSRPARIVPVLCGPILEAMQGKTDPLAVEPVAKFVAALRAVLSERKGRIGVIASVDLSHVGKRFNDSDGVGPARLASIESEDRALLKHAENVDAAAFFEHNRRDGDRRNVCGFPALYALLAAVPAKRGRLLHYAQSPEKDTDSVVTFAAMAFEK